ncbi:hypothetical protein [Ktedonospora formicarum]|uniref:hypothetical protein n=1 Tax=Ktedonospora formicarum TaxID=2778364 RepID=UPI001C68BFBE|nr:hypothetical protein [Ktedonospora formicarum]
MLQRISVRQAQRNQVQTKINWRFNTADARIKLKRLYPSFNSGVTVYQYRKGKA